MSNLGSQNIGNLRRRLSWLVLGALTCAALFLAVGGLLIALYLWLDGQANVSAPAAVLSAAGLATLGWLSAASNQRMLSRKQHTLNLLIQWRHSAQYHAHLEAVTLLAPRGTALTSRQVDLLTDRALALTPHDKAFVAGATYILNYWEFVCAAVLVKDLDAELIRRTVRPHIVGTHAKFAAMIQVEQAANPQMFIHLRRLSETWAKPEGGPKPPRKQR